MRVAVVQKAPHRAMLAVAFNEHNHVRAHRRDARSLMAEVIVKPSHGLIDRKTVGAARSPGCMTWGEAEGRLQLERLGRQAEIRGMCSIGSFGRSVYEVWTALQVDR